MGNRQQLVMLFDYDQLDAETRIVVQQRTGEIKGLMKRTAQDIIEIGDKLIEVKGRLPHGSFGGWLGAEFEWNTTTAWNFMNVAEKFSNFENLDQFGASALYLLAAPSTPDEARQEAVERAENGERITHKKAKDIAQAHADPVAFQQATPALRPNGSIGRASDGAGFLGWMSDAQESGLVEQEFVCLVCDDFFDAEVWHCPACAHHWPMNLDTCKNCYKPRPSEEPKLNKLAVHHSSETPEHYTPSKVIDAVLTLLGEIDLDPCSNSHTAPNIEARQHFTMDDDGLQRSWKGRVYMNPPYGREIGKWVDKLCNEHEYGSVTEAIALLPARPDTQWWKRLRDYPVCFVEGRLTFIGNDDPAPFPSAIFYMGNDIDRFYYEFIEMGDIWQCLNPEMFGS